MSIPLISHAMWTTRRFLELPLQFQLLAVSAVLALYVRFQYPSLCHPLIDSLQFTGIVVYRLHFHPLARYPGPFWARVTNWYSVYHAYIGDKHLQHYWAHKKYGLFDTLKSNTHNPADTFWVVKGSIVRMAPNLITFNKVDAIKDIYGVHRNVSKSKFYQPAIEIAGFENMFNSRNKVLHAQKRRILAPAFTEASLKSMQDLILKHIDEFFQEASASALYKSAEKSWHADLGKWANYLTFDVMGDLVFGKDYGMLRGSESRDLPFIIDAAVHWQFLAGCSSFLHRWGLVKVLFPSIFKRASGFMPYAKAQVKLREEAAPDRIDFFSYIEKAKDQDGRPAFKASREVFAEARALIVGASDTTATQLAANFFYLTNNPYALHCLEHEIRATFESHTEIRLGEELDKCRYLRAVVNETLRISPSLPGVLPREVLSGGLTVAGELVPAGVEVSVPIYAIHHNEDTFFEPHRFIPERWLSEYTSEMAVKRALESLVPFSYGSRQCIGKRLAVIEIHLALARAVWQYDVEYVGGGKEDRFVNDPDVVEYKLLDHLAAGRSGPVIRFRKRDVN